MTKIKLLPALCLALLVFALSSCEGETSISTAYSVGIFQLYSTNPIEEVAAIENYIKKQGAPYGSVIKTGKSESENDKNMKAEFDSVVSKLDFSTLGLLPTTYFTYSVQGAYDESGNSRTVASYSFPQ